MPGCPGHRSRQGTVLSQWQCPGARDTGLDRGRPFPNGTFTRRPQLWVRTETETVGVSHCRRSTLICRRAGFGDDSRTFPTGPLGVVRVLPHTRVQARRGRGSLLSSLRGRTVMGKGDARGKGTGSWSRQTVRCPRAGVEPTVAGGGELLYWQSRGTTVDGTPFSSTVLAEPTTSLDT